MGVMEIIYNGAVLPMLPQFGHLQLVNRTINTDFEVYSEE